MHITIRLGGFGGTAGMDRELELNYKNATEMCVAATRCGAVWVIGSPSRQFVSNSSERL